MKKCCIYILLLLLASFHYACTHHEPHDLYGAWQIDKLLLDAMDRTGRGKYELPWGSGIELKPDGNFITNFSQKDEAKGSWRISPDGDKLYLQFDSAQKLSFDITMSRDYLVLKSVRWHVFLSRIDALPEPVKREVNLANLLPGTWYFYEMNTPDSVIQYPRSRRQAHWLKIGWGGNYLSGEGKHKSFQGKWLLQKDTLTLNEEERAWQEQWKVRLEDGMLYFESLHDMGKDWYEVSLVHEANLKR